MDEKKHYQVVNGTSYDARTPQAVIDILERSRETKLRLAILYGNTETKEVWHDATPNRGHIGRSTGEVKIPLLVRTRRSMGGEAVLDYCIIQIRESKGGKVLYDATK
jgi:hypothetical protein